MGTLSLVLDNLKDLEECMDDGDLRVAKEAKLFDALEHKSVVIEVDNKKIAIFSKASLWAFEKVLENMGFVNVSLSDYCRKMVNDVIMEIHRPSQAKKLSSWEKQTAIKAITLTNSLPPLEARRNSTNSTIPPQLIYHPLTTKQKEKIKEVLDIKYKEKEESKPILKVLENYVVYKKKLDEILVSKERLNKKEFSKKDKVGIIEHGLLKKMCDLRNYVLPVKINDLGLTDHCPYQTNLTLADNTQAKAMGEVKNVRIQIGYQAYMVDLLILDIPVDPELPLLLERPFLRTCEAIIDMGRGTLCIDDRVIHHTYFPKTRSKSYIEAFEMEGEDD
nr:hypothetical protein [Tanacetum cinerariifolium]